MAVRESTLKSNPESAQPNREPESPFLDEELFADVEAGVAEEWASGLVGYQLESPFQYAFEQEREAFLEPEVDEPEAELHDEELEEAELAELFAGEEEDLEAEDFLHEVNDQELIYEVEDETLAELLANELDIPETEEYYEIIDEPDDDEVVAELEDEVLERLNKLTGDQSAIEEQSPPPIQPTKEPLAVPVSDPVPFAPPPPMGSCWPVRSTHRRGREVAFRATDGTTVGNRSRAFMAQRTSKKKGKTIKRYHVGIDLYAKRGDPVVACEDGVIVNFHRFLGKTRALIVEHANVVINYGEVVSNSLMRTGLEVGSSVKAGQIIGYVGLLPKGSSMLHFETYRKGTTSNKRWYRHKKPPSEVLNPTKYLLFLQQHGLVEKDTIGQPVPSAPDTGRSIDLKRAVRLNRHYGQKLGWHDHYESIERFLGFTDISPSEETLAEAVAEWQRSQGLQADGIIGPQTWKLLQGALWNSRRSTSSFDLERAIRQNRRYGQRLGWHNQQFDIERLLGFKNESPSEARFAEAVAGWQQSQGLEVDGIIGPNTWLAVKQSLGLSTSGTSGTSQSSLLSGPKIPPGFKLKKRKGKNKGLERYASERLDTKLFQLRANGLINISDNDIDTLQRIANVETSGRIQGINTWDSATVSIGFMQWTLLHDKVQEWIRRDPIAFQKFGIELDEGRKYIWTFTRKDGTKRQVRAQAIVGVQNKNDLRWNGWAERFYSSGLDDAVLAAEVPLAIEWLNRHLRRIKRYLRKKGLDYDVFERYYSQSPYLRGMFQAAYNNLPAAAKVGTANAVRKAIREGNVSVERFLEIYKSAILQAYRARDDDGSRIVSETRLGARNL